MDAATFRAIDPRTGQSFGPHHPQHGAADVHRCVLAAREAFGQYRRTTPDRRAAFLESVADEIEARRAAIAAIATRETGLPAGRIDGETTRTTNQLRLFAQTLREGTWLGVRIDPADPDRRPLPAPDVRRRCVPLGPVAVFGASNFPLAFSVAGGDTASALAAGAPVVVKAHPSHPGTSALVGSAISAAVQAHGLPAGTFGLLQGATHELGTALVAHPGIAAVGFTGSRGGGLALVAVAQQRPVPIPVYAEMSSVNPVFVLPGALLTRAAQIGAAYVASVTGSGGQLCTKPGLLLLIDGPQAQTLLDAAASALADLPTGPLLTPRIAEAYAPFDRITPDVRLVASGRPDDSIACAGTPLLLETTAAHFLATPALQEEMFGPASLIVRAGDEKELAAVAKRLEGQLTATVHADVDDHPVAAELLETLELLAGRVIINGWPTGVEVNHAMVHGGPYPATSAPATTSVGTSAIERWLRPVAYQDVPDALLPAELRDANPLEIPRRTSRK